MHNFFILMPIPKRPGLRSVPALLQPESGEADRPNPSPSAADLSKDLKVKPFKRALQTKPVKQIANGKMVTPTPEPFPADYEARIDDFFRFIDSLHKKD